MDPRGNTLIHQYFGSITAASRSFIFAGISNISIFIRPSPSDDLVSCRNALFLTNPFDDRTRLISTMGKRVSDACTWVTQQETYIEWEESRTSPVLWLSAGPDKGKTTLSIYLTEQLEQRQKQVVYFFCVNSDETRNSATAAMRSILWQITEKQPQLTHHLLKDLGSEQRRRASLLSVETLWRLFETVCNDPDFDPVVCVIDGLDKCDEDSIQRLATRIVDHAAKQTPSPCKMIIVSRPIEILERSMAARIKLD